MMLFGACWLLIVIISTAQASKDDELTVYGQGKVSYSFIMPKTDTAGGKCHIGNLQELQKLRKTVQELTQKLNSSTCGAYGGGGYSSGASGRRCSCQCRTDVTYKFKYRDCQDVKKLSPVFLSGRYDIYPIDDVNHLMLAETRDKKNKNMYWSVTVKEPIPVFCDLSSSMDLGWTVIQRRTKFDVSFDRVWADYKKGFGDLNGDFWLGLDNMHRLTNQKTLTYMLRVTRWSRYGNTNIPFVRDYDSVKIANENSKYYITLGTARGYTFVSYMDNFGSKYFSTKDKDNTSSSYKRYACASSYSSSRGGGWWFGSYSNYYCGSFNPNARYPQFGSQSSSYKIELKIRPVNA